MNTIDSSISSIEPPSLKRVKSINQRLVKILQHKMFKGYREIKNSKNFNLKKPKYIQDAFWENRILDPFDDNYNLDYKRKNLSTFFKRDLTNMLQINNCSKKKDLNQKNKSKKLKLNKKYDNQNKNKNSRKNQNINLHLKKRPVNDKYFYFSSNSLLIRNDLDDNYKQKKDKLFKTIFSAENEKGLYNDIPIFAIEKIHKINDNKKKKFIYLPSKEERMRDLQFLYKVSHKLPIKKTDFRTKYNIKSAKERKKNNTVENAIITSISHKIQSAKPNQNRLSLRKNESDIFMTTVRNNNNIIKNKSFRNEFKENEDLCCRNFHNTILKRAQSSSAYKSRNKKLIRNFSADIINNKRDFYYNIKNNKKIYSRPELFPSMNRFVNDQMVLNYINYKKSQFEKLKNIIEN